MGRNVVARLSIAAALAVGHGAVEATEAVKYTSTSDCNTANTCWTVTNTCGTKTSTSTVGSDCPNALTAAVEYEPGAQSGEPSARLTDCDGRPILGGTGVAITLQPSASSASQAQALYGLLSPQHVWRGFRSDVAFVTPGRDSTTRFVIQYCWAGPVGTTGKTWISDESDVACGFQVTDGTSNIPSLFVPALSAVGLVALALLLAGTFLWRMRR